jgi:hypothetical protein
MRSARFDNTSPTEILFMEPESILCGRLREICSRADERSWMPDDCDGQAGTDHATGCEILAGIP